MKGYKINVIEEYVSTALISEDPNEALIEAITVLINLAPDQEDDALDYLHHKEKQLPIRKSVYEWAHSIYERFPSWTTLATKPRPIHESVHPSLRGVPTLS